MKEGSAARGKGTSLDIPLPGQTGINLDPKTGKVFFRRNIEERDEQVKKILAKESNNNPRLNAKLRVLWTRWFTYKYGAKMPSLEQGSKADILSLIWIFYFLSLLRFNSILWMSPLAAKQRPLHTKRERPHTYFPAISVFSQELIRSRSDALPHQTFDHQKSHLSWGNSSYPLASRLEVPKYA